MLYGFGPLYLRKVGGTVNLPQETKANDWRFRKDSVRKE